MEDVSATRRDVARRCSQRSRRLIAALLWLGWGMAHGSPPDSAFQVELLLSSDAPMYREFAGAFQVELSIACADRCPVTPSVRTSVVGDWPAAAPRDLLITVGNEAALEAARLGATKVVYGLIPEATWHTVQQLRPQADGDASAVFLEQPLARQFRLLKAAMPENRQRVGVVLGPESWTQHDALAEAAIAEGLVLKVQRVWDQDQVGATVEALAAQTDMLLAIPDSLVFNRDNLYGIILTSYSAGVPLVGYSEGLVNAGAMLGLYTAVPNMARQLAQLSAAFIAGAHALPPASRSRYFEIAVNRNVARSLGIDLPEPPALRLQVNSAR
jgi:ABC-type uncharacterized transport system substrate-binding protein